MAKADQAYPNRFKTAISGTQASYDDAAVILIVDKIESLVRSQDAGRLNEAWDCCKAQAPRSYWPSCPEAGR